MDIPNRRLSLRERDRNWQGLANREHYFFESFELPRWFSGIRWKSKVHLNDLGTRPLAYIAESKIDIVMACSEARVFETRI